MLAAYSDLELRPDRAAALGADLHKFSDAFAVNRHERVTREHAFLEISAEKQRRVVSRNAECRLRQVVRAE